MYYILTKQILLIFNLEFLFNKEAKTMGTKHLTFNLEFLFTKKTKTMGTKNGYNCKTLIPTNMTKFINIRSTSTKLSLGSYPVKSHFGT